VDEPVDAPRDEDENDEENDNDDSDSIIFLDHSCGCLWFLVDVAVVGVVVCRLDEDNVCL
jgi:hypothetical protein